MSLSARSYNAIRDWLASQLQAADPDRNLSGADLESFIATASGGTGATGSEPKYSFYVSSFDGVRPPGSGSTFGVTITPGNNAKGSWVQAIAAAAMAQDTYIIQVELNSSAVSTAIRSTLVDVGVDPAGGTNYSVVIPDLIATACSFTTAGFGVRYTFRLKITAGSSIALRASVNNATVGTLKGMVSCWGQPSIPVRAGVGVRAFGITAATSTGTPIAGGDVGTVSDGAWTQLGTVADDCWQWQLGCGIDNGTMAALGYRAALGIGDSASTIITGSKFVAQPDARIVTGTTEVIWLDQPALGTVYSAIPGDKVYGKIWCSGTPDTGIVLAGYATYGTA